MQAITFDFNNTANAFEYKTDAELRRAHALFSLMNQSWLVYMGTRLTPWAFNWHLPIKGIVRNTIYKQFCGGEKLDQASEVINKIGHYHVNTILDYGVEGKESDAEFDHATDIFIKSIQFASKNKYVPYISLKVTGITRFALLEKLHAKKTLTDAESADWERTKTRLHKICKAAADYNIGLYIDAEETWIQDPIDELVYDLMRVYNQGKAVVFNTIQLYRHDRLTHMKKAFKDVQPSGCLFAIKMVRGAYMEKERKRAAEMGYASPIQPDKASTDRDYDSAVQFCMDNIERISFCVATHNEYSNRVAAEMMLQRDITPTHPHVWFSQLYGMSDNISFNLAEAGFNVSKYLPYGPVRDVVPYLMRRAQENTSVKGQTGRELKLIEAEVKRRGLLR